MMRVFLAAAIMGALALAASAQPESPYQGQESRQIKALSAEEVEAYLSGSGMGFAKAAELNRYPGPRHVLELAEELALTAGQIEQTQAVFDAMHAEAIRLGEQLVEKERELDERFANESINTASLGVLVSEISELRARIRTTHLTAHLQQKTLLTDHQIQRYDGLRGYGTAHDGSHSRSH